MLRDYRKPYQKEAEEADVLCVRIPRRVLRALKAKLAAEGLTATQWVQRQAEEYLNRTK